MTFWRALLIIAWVGLTAAAPQPVAKAYQDISLAALIDNPVVYEGRKVTVRAFMTSDHGGYFLWKDEADHRAQKLEQAVWLATPNSFPHHETLNGRWTFVSGRVATGGRYGHLGDLRTAIVDPSALVADAADTDRARPWINDPLFVILASLGLLGLVLAITTLSRRAQSAATPPNRP